MSKNADPEVIEDLDFELIIGDAGGQIDNGDVPIRWCVTPTLVKSLEARGVVDPHILIASYSPDQSGDYVNEMDRKMVPLSELMTYLRFTRAGVMKVHGIILNGKTGRAALFAKYLKKNYGEYDAIVNGYDGKLFSASNMDYAIETTGHLVEIPENVFGKEPSPWVKWYVNLWHDAKSKVTDECDFRKRAFIAIICKWMAVIPWVIGLVLYRLVVAGAIAGAGYFKNVNLLRAFRPYKYPSLQLNVLDMPIDWVDDNFFIMKRKMITKQSWDKKVSLITGLAFTPLLAFVISIAMLLTFTPDGIIGFGVILGSIVASIAMFLMAIDLFGILIEILIKYESFGRMARFVGNLLDKVFGRFTGWNIDWKLIGGWLLAITAVGVAVVAIKTILALLGLMVLTMVLTVIVFGVMFFFAEKIADWLDKFLAISADKNDYNNISTLLCPKDEDNLRPNIHYIPKRQRTVRLWFLDMKNKVCKPMQS